MEHDRPPPHAFNGPGPRVGETEADYRERLTQERAMAQERWEQALREQTAPENDAAARIRVWERRHQLELPRSPTHRLIAVIAAGTDLSVEEVLAELHARAAARQPAAAKTEG